MNGKTLAEIKMSLQFAFTTSIINFVDFAKFGVFHKKIYDEDKTVSYGLSDKLYDHCCPI